VPHLPVSAWATHLRKVLVAVVLGLPQQSRQGWWRQRQLWQQRVELRVPMRGAEATQEQLSVQVLRSERRP
jgi:hypothetical protein